MKNRLKIKKTIVLVLCLIVTIVGGVLFVGAVSGWFDTSKVSLDAEYKCEDKCDEFIELDVATYNDLVLNKKSFVVFVDQGGCVAADRLRQYVMDFAKEQGIKFYKMMFIDVKKTSLYESVRYYPSVVLVSDGRVVAWLRADSEEDAERYNNYNDFNDWLKKHLK